MAPSAYTLEFEKPLAGARAPDRGAQAARRGAADRRRAPSSRRWRTSSTTVRAEIYRNLTPHPARAGGAPPAAAVHARLPAASIFTDFIELHGDRLFRDDPAIVGGWARLGGDVGDGDRPPEGPRHQGEHQAQLRHAAPRGLPQGAPADEARRALRRAGHHAHRHARAPTPASAPRSAGSPRRSRATSSRCRALPVPIIAVVIGEGGSGGALALGVADRILMLENSVYSVISPEGCAAILWKDASQRERAAEALKLTAEDLLRAQGDRRDRSPSRWAAPTWTPTPRARRCAPRCSATSPSCGRSSPRSWCVARREVRRDGRLRRSLMPQTVEVRFKGTRRDFFHWPQDDATAPPRGGRSSCAPTAGEDFGRVSAVGDVAAKKCGGRASTCGPARGSAATRPWPPRTADAAARCRAGCAAHRRTRSAGPTSSARAEDEDRQRSVARRCASTSST